MEKNWGDTPSATLSYVQSYNLRILGYGFV